MTGAISSLVRHFSLVSSMARREIEARYRESMFGLAWAVLSPLLMLAVYAFVFGTIMGSRWPGGSGDFVVLMFAGLSVYGFFAEVAGRSASLITGNANLARKVVFPLDILSWIAVGTALVGLAINVVLLQLLVLFTGGSPPWTVVLFPLVVLPLVLGTVGVSWFLAATAPFIRDVGQFVGFGLTALLFVSPIFYPVSAIPARFRPLLELNPLTFYIEEARKTLVHGSTVDWPALALQLLLGAIVMAAGHAWFTATRRAAVDLI